MQYLEQLEVRWGRERIHQAIQPLFIGDGEEPGDLPITVLNASVNDPELWQHLTDEERERLYLAFMELQYDLSELATDLHRANEPDLGGFELTTP
ncbi:hypothetical protein F5984_24270 [Rudanella paleaurantiibacter]|uniref:Uncharacterized protein n=1 Tax=Rudanella paleaurantiibacter TaxID=2614655 RepID=A0A7J5TT74_9BACT|nr:MULTISPECIES: hypothetical protein [Rudanella]KAB7726440.1 hypothetical protein F5984_24270 [Rudanella paleaurantiibacter]